MERIFTTKDRAGILLQHAVPVHTTVNAEYYSKVKLVENAV